MKKAIWYIMVVAATLIALILLWQFSLAILLFALSLAVSAALKPLILRVAGERRSRRFALGTVYSLVFGFVLVLLILGGQFLLQDLQRATDDFAVTYDYIKTEWPRTDSIFKQTLAEQLPSSNDIYQAMTSEEGIITMAGNGGPGKNFFSSFGNIAVVLVLSLYWSADQLRFERISISMFPAEYRPKALKIWRSIETGVGGYIRSEFTQSVLAGLLLWAGYQILGLRYPTLLALWGAVVRLIPWFGVLVAIIPLIFIGGSLTFSSLLSIFYTVIVLLLLKIIIEPRVLKEQRSNSLLIVLFVIVLAQAFGLTGVLLAPPLAVAVQILIQEVFPLFPRRYSEELQEALELKKRLFHVRKFVKNSLSPENMQLVQQLRKLVIQTITYMQKY